MTADMPRTLAFYRALGLPIPDGAHLNKSFQVGCRSVLNSNRAE